MFPYFIFFIFFICIRAERQFCDVYLLCAFVFLYSPDDQDDRFDEEGLRRKGIQEEGVVRLGLTTNLYVFLKTSSQLF